MKFINFFSFSLTFIVKKYTQQYKKENRITDSKQFRLDIHILHYFNDFSFFFRYVAQTVTELLSDQLSRFCLLEGLARYCSSSSVVNDLCGDIASMGSENCDSFILISLTSFVSLFLYQKEFLKLLFSSFNQNKLNLTFKRTF